MLVRKSKPSFLIMTQKRWLFRLNTSLYVPFFAIGRGSRWYGLSRSILAVVPSELIGLFSLRPSFWALGWVHPEAFQSIFERTGRVGPQRAGHFGLCAPVDRPGAGNARCWITFDVSAGVLAEWQPRPGMKPVRYVLDFAHHMLCDYGVARML